MAGHCARFKIKSINTSCRRELAFPEPIGTVAYTGKENSGSCKALEVSLHDGHRSNDLIYDRRLAILAVRCQQVSLIRIFSILPVRPPGVPPTFYFMALLRTDILAQLSFAVRHACSNSFYRLLIFLRLANLYKYNIHTGLPDRRLLIHARRLPGWAMD